MEQLMNHARGRLKTDKTSSVNIDIENRERILPVDHTEVSVNLYNIYLAERENAEKYRLIFSINPICSNVLHNANTEIVKNEGSANVCILGNSAVNILQYCKKQPFNSNFALLTRQSAINDTEFSHPYLGGFTYHCGMDIFDNHTLRQNGYLPLQGDQGATPYFNTLEDRARDSRKNTIMEKVIRQDPANPEDVEMHKYNHDNLLSFDEAFSSNRIEKDGWFGFYNPSTTPISMGTYNGEDIYINKCMNNNKPCEFYDMYPDRELYSFIPKVNNFRQGREEKNWDYCLTYPAKIRYTYNGCDYLYDSNADVHGILALSATAIGQTIYIETMIKHGLVADDEAILYFSYDGSNFGESRVWINNTGDVNREKKRYIIAVSKLDISSDWQFDDSGNVILPRVIRVAKFSDGYAHDYYFREFRKIPNPTVLEKTFTDDELMTEGMIAEANKKRPFTSVIGKMGFARNIYGDMIAQLIYNDDVNVKHITDHRGRPLSEIFLTIVKRNAGHNEWYNGNPGSEKVEFSHCFGKVSAGLDIVSNCAYNVHAIHDVDTSKGDVAGLGIPTSQKRLADDITVDDEYFIGDIVDWSPYDVSESTLETVQFRFNTYQREMTSGQYNGIVFHELVYDDLDWVEGRDESVQNFTLTEDRYAPEGMRGNVFPEGYFYKAHYRIQLREYSDTIESYYDTRIVFYKSQAKDLNGNYRLTTSINYPIDVNDQLRIRYDDNFYVGKIVQMDDQRTITLSIDGNLSRELDTYRQQHGVDPFITGVAEVYMPNLGLPMGAQYLPNSEGIYHYRSFKPYYMSDNERLKNATFTNDALYLENEVILFLRRQDPFGEYGLNYKKGVMSNLTTYGYVINAESEEYVDEKDMTVCK